MAQSALYDEDILLWSEQQAEVIRRLARTRRDLPNELDVENVAEEIESVGRSEFASVKSLVRQILMHLIKLIVEPDAAPVRHWRAEIVAFHAEMLDHYAPSMRQRIDMDDLWRFARQQLLDTYEGVQSQRVAELPDHWPIDVDDLFIEALDQRALEDRLRRAVASGKT
jgi:hypothetical protein